MVLGTKCCLIELSELRYSADHGSDPFEEVDPGKPSIKLQNFLDKNKLKSPSLWCGSIEGGKYICKCTKEESITKSEVEFSENKKQKV
jgi:hypothetical protein